MILKQAVWSGVAALVFAGAGLAQVTAMRGEVKGEDGKGQKDAVILIERKDIKGNYKTKTNKRGEFYYGGLPRGTYDVTCEVNGTPMDKVNGIQTRLGDPVEVTFDLQAVKKRRDEMNAAASSGQLSADMARSMSAEQKAAFDKANKERQEAMAKNKALNDAFNVGMQAEQAKQWDVAVESFKKASEMDPKQDVVWAHLADSYIQLGLSKTNPERETLIGQGAQAWNQAIAIKPDNPGYHNNFALALARAGKFAEAETELQKAATIDPPNAGKYYFNLGALLVNSSKYEEAAVQFKKAIETTPNYAEAHYQYAMCLASKLSYTADGKVIPPEGMKDELETYLKLAPTGPNAESAKQMIETLSAGVQTTYTNPNAPPPAKKSKKR